MRQRRRLRDKALVDREYLAASATAVLSMEIQASADQSAAIQASADQSAAIQASADQSVESAPLPETLPETQHHQ